MIAKINLFSNQKTVEQCKLTVATKLFNQKTHLFFTDAFRFIKLFYNFNITCKNELFSVLGVGNFNLVALVDEKNIHTIGHGDVIILALNLQVVNRVAVIYRSFDILNLDRKSVV